MKASFGVIDRTRYNGFHRDPPRSAETLHWNGIQATKGRHPLTVHLLEASFVLCGLLKRLVHRPLCQRSCRLNRIGTFGGADSRKWLDTDKRTKNG